MKRLTETTKWDDPWFRKLSPEMKCFWGYICDRCDAAGVWAVDMEQAAFSIGAKLDAGKVWATFGERMEKVPNGNGECWRILKFVQFQFKNLSRDCKPHNATFAAIEKHGLQEDEVSNGLRSSKVSHTFAKGCLNLLDKEEDKETDKAEEKDTEADVAASIYALYPRKEGKQAALKAIRAALRVKPAADLTSAVTAYAAATAVWQPLDRQFIPHPSTWFNEGRYDDDRATWQRQPSHANHRPNPRGFANQQDYSGVTDH